MVNFDASTPQLRVVKNWVDAYLSLDAKNLEPLISKDFQYETFPEADDVSREARERHLESFRGVLSGVNKFDVTYHEVIETPGKVVIHVLTVFSPLSGAPVSYEGVAILTLVEEDGELKILHCKSFADPQKRYAMVAAVIKAASANATA